mmetsp:Transcript_22405/g.48756  ORF Transcript_22405/g.48756 Transcript_22405/m.48756 type:complete len:531 (-) Transcript_22405:79-1671(-)|eukprot:CAMPEP_0168731810 /NCGR_PEP_ID=MMETSP0724-20121128/7451_1 /TAXON_ID=265536 /ORGANISM="Amphiprora sp., Strain CCMP467" /LENGTH=530 /DNA_ID=CAMNT_0008778817 /DNA_START=329 /DNA_END=1921 /DNA_ORIENTATION=-
MNNTSTSDSHAAADDDISIPWDQRNNNDVAEDGDHTKVGSLDLAKKGGFQNGLYPETEEELDKAEQVLSNELAKLSMNEHEEAMFDVVGLRNNAEEDAAFLDTKLAELDQELRKISGSRKKAYEAACKLNPEYVQGRKFRLTFLRSKQFDPKKAAGVIINHFYLKKKVFADYPSEFYGREVKFTDLGPGAQEIVEGGYAQVSQSNDAAGRPVIYFSTAFNVDWAMESTKQALWYFWTCRSRNENAQRNGEVAVAYCEQPRRFNLKYMELGFFVQRLKNAFPVEIQAVHCCGASMSASVFWSAHKLIMDNFTRFRTKEHSGTLEEINFALQTYGVNTDNSPMQPDNTFDTTFYKKWLGAQKQYEESNSSRQATLVPHRFDVLFGKTKLCTHHPGTIRCQLLVDMHWEEYDKQSRAEKGLIADKIVNIVQESGGRFLKWEGGIATGAWVEVDDKAAREKVTHFFRSRRSKKQKSQNQARTSAPKRGIDNATETDTVDSIAMVPWSTESSDASLFSKRMRAPEIDNISESLDT